MMNLLVWSEKLLRIKAHSIATKLSQKCVTMCFNTRIPKSALWALFSPGDCKSLALIW